MKTIDTCRCSIRHRTFGAFARCCWRRAEWIDGEGEFAVVAYCCSNRPGSLTGSCTITLCDTFDDAKAAKRQIDEVGCGGICTRNHRLLYLLLPAPVRWHDEEVIR